MAAKSSPETKSNPAVMADAVDFASAALAQTAERGQAAVTSGLETWTREAQAFYEQMSEQGATALAQLAACRSPLEVLEVEQAWLTARSKAYLESGQRFAQAFAKVAESLTSAALTTER
jgi:hypothetical protein